MTALLDTKKILDEIVAIVDDRKGENIKVIDLTGKGAFVDFMVIATGNSTRQLDAISHYIARYLKDNNILPHVEGSFNSEWVLIDAGDIVVHLFTPDMRLFYGLEKIWSPHLV
jgi:ribosome-associated protein